ARSRGGARRPRSRPGLSELLDAHGIDGAEGRLLVRREVAPGGGGRVFLNGSATAGAVVRGTAGRVSLNGAPATVAVLRTIADELVEMHAQNDRAELLSPERHQDVLDA